MQTTTMTTKTEPRPQNGERTKQKETHKIDTKIISAKKCWNTRDNNNNDDDDDGDDDDDMHDGWKWCGENPR